MEYPTLSGVKRADVVIVGGGLTGLLLGSSLVRQGVRVTIVDAQQPGSKASAICSGVGTVMHIEALERIVKHAGKDAARQHVHSLRDILMRLPERFSRFTPVQDISMYTYAYLPRDLPALDKQFSCCADLGIPVIYAPDAGGCPFPVELSLVLEHQVMLDVPALLDVLGKRIVRSGGRIYGNSRVVDIDSAGVYTSEGCVEAPLIVLATGMPLGVRRLSLLAMLETRTVVSCQLTSSVPLHTCQQSVRPGGLSLRPVQGGALASWTLGRAGTRIQQTRFSIFEEVLKRRLADWEAALPAFSQDIWPLDGLPCIGVLPEYHGHVLCATGYSGYGVTGAALAARVLTRHILGKPAPGDTLYRPDRRLPRNILVSQVRQLMQHYALGSLRRRAPVCPHRGCRLRFSEAALRWECPFCGSIFGLLGTRISGPSLRSARISARQRPDL